MHFANYVGNFPNKLRTVHDELVVHVHQSRNFRRISLEEKRIAGMLYPEWQLFMLQECLAAYRWLRGQDVPCTASSWPAIRREAGWCSPP
jgi:hypothetical protein